MPMRKDIGAVGESRTSAYRSHSQQKPKYGAMTENTNLVMTTSDVCWTRPAVIELHESAASYCAGLLGYRVAAKTVISKKINMK